MKLEHELGRYGVVHGFESVVAFVPSEHRINNVLDLGGDVALHLHGTHPTHFDDRLAEAFVGALHDTKRQVEDGAVDLAGLHEPLAELFFLHVGAGEDDVAVFENETLRGVPVPQTKVACRFRAPKIAHDSGE